MQEEKLWYVAETKDPKTLFTLTLIVSATWTIAIFIALPWIAFLNIFHQPQSTPNHLQSYSWLYAVALVSLTAGTSGAVIGRDSFGLKWSSRILVCMVIVLIVVFWFQSLNKPEETPSIASAFAFIGYMLFVWLARLSLWVSWLHLPGKLELKIHDIIVALLASAAVVSRWADLSGVEIFQFNAAFVFGGTTAFGLLLAKYTYEIAEIISSKKSFSL